MGGASFGFPPAPHHLCGLPRLKLSLNDWENVVTPPVTEENDNKGSSTTTVLDGEWEELIEQFMADPCWTKFELFRDSDKVFDAFEEIKKDKRYKWAATTSRSQLTSGREWRKRKMLSSGQNLL